MYKYCVSYGESHDETIGNEFATLHTRLRQARGDPHARRLPVGVVHEENTFSFDRIPEGYRAPPSGDSKDETGRLIHSDEVGA